MKLLYLRSLFITTAPTQYLLILVGLMPNVLTARTKEEFRLSHYQNGNVLAGIGACYNNIGIVYYHLGEYDKTLDFYKKSLAIDQQLGDEHGIATSYNNIGSVYTDFGDFKSALENLLKGLNLRLKLGLMLD